MIKTDALIIGAGPTGLFTAVKRPVGPAPIIKASVLIIYACFDGMLTTRPSNSSETVN